MLHIHRTTSFTQYSPLCRSSSRSWNSSLVTSSSESLPMKAKGFSTAIAAVHFPGSTGCSDLAWRTSTATGTSPVWSTSNILARKRNGPSKQAYKAWTGLVCPRNRGLHGL